MKKSIGQAKLVTKEQEGKFLNVVRWAFVVQLTGNKQKNQNSAFWVGWNWKLRSNKRQLARQKGGRLLGVLGQQKHLPLGSLAWIMLGVWRFEAWEFGGEFKASPFWVSSSFSSSYFVSTYDSLLILVL